MSKKHLSFPDCFSVPWIVQVALNCQLDIQEWLIRRLFVRRLNPIRIPTCSPLGPDATVCTFVVFGNWLLSARGPRLCPKRGWETQTKLNSDEFELKFPELSPAELGGLWAEPSQAWASQLSNWNQADFIYINKKQIFTA